MVQSHEDQFSASECSERKRKHIKTSKKHSDHSRLAREISKNKHLERIVRDLQLQLDALQSIVQTQQTNTSTLATQNNFECLMQTDITPTSDNDTPQTSSTRVVKTSEPSLHKLTYSKPASANGQTTPANAKKAERPKPSSPTIKPPSESNRKPPPIVVSQLNIKAASTLLTTLIGSDSYNFRRVSADKTHIVTKTLADFKVVLETLKQSDTKHHTFTPKEEQHTNIVLRHLDKSYDAEDIAQGIASLALDINVVKIMRLPTNQNNLWLIQLQAGSDATQLLGQRFLLHQKVIFERKRHTQIAQCKNCQQFGHSARNCHHDYRCVKCKSQHGPGNCPRTLNPQLAESVSPSCVNCQSEDHPANYRGCPAYVKILQKKQQKQTTPAVTVPSRQAQPSASTRTAGRSYAAALSDVRPAVQPTQQKSTPRAPHNVFDYIDTECTKHFNMEFAELHTRTKDFFPLYASLPENKRAVALINFTLSLSQ